MSEAEKLRERRMSNVEILEKMQKEDFVDEEDKEKVAELLRNAKSSKKKKATTTSGPTVIKAHKKEDHYRLGRGKRKLFYLRRCVAIVKVN